MTGELFVIGFGIGLSLMAVYGIVSGLFGREAVLGIFVVACVLTLITAATTGVETAANDLLPLPYWAGLALGSILGAPISLAIDSELSVDGTPRVVAYIQGVRSE